MGAIAASPPSAPFVQQLGMTSSVDDVIPRGTEDIMWATGMGLPAGHGPPVGQEVGGTT